ncbi:MAG: MBL fold metallo-hydrolase, partial [bacterium]|nr:MBL fold metallo-hydrolase [bacterium]
VKIKTTTGKVIYIDPYFPTKFSYREPADFILVTHGHSDHNNMSLCTQKEDCKVIKWGDALIDGEYQVFEYDDIRIEAVPSGGNSNHKITNNVGYLVTVDGVTVYHSGDTSFAEETKCIADKEIDYAMYTVNGAYTMGPEEATEMADYIGARVNIPIHGNGNEYWKQRKAFSANGTKRLLWSQTIFLRR